MDRFFSVKSFSWKFSWNWFHGNLYIYFGITSKKAAAETHPFPFFKVLYSSFLFLYLFFFVSSARLPPYFRVSNFFSLLFLLDKKWIVNFFHHILILLYKLISFLSEWWIKSATNFNTWSRSVLWNIYSIDMWE